MKFLKSAKDFIVKSEILLSIIALILSLAVSSIIIIIAGYSPFEAYGAMLSGAFGSSYNLAQTVGTAIPLIFAGLAMATASKVGMFNIGVEGQMIVGAFAAALVGTYVTGLPAWLHLPLCILAAAVTGGLWAMVVAVLKNKLHINEVILTIMMNYVALYVVGYLVNYPFRAEGKIIRTETIQETATMSTLVPHTRLYTGIFLAIVVAIVLWYVLKNTRFGYELRAVGSNPDAAEAAGINKKKYALMAMFISGALAGIGGAGEVLGFFGYYISNMTTGYGFDGIAIATMGRGNPFGTTFAALLFGVLRNGATGMNRSTNIPGEFIEVLQALVILFVSTPGIIRYVQKRMKRVRTGVKEEGTK